MIDDPLEKPSPEDRAKVDSLQVEWERIGDAAFDQFADKDPVTYLRLIALYRPKAVRDALENAAIEAGLTNADIRVMRERALRIN